MTEWLPFHFSLSCIGEGSGNPLQCSCLENPRDGSLVGCLLWGLRVGHNWSDLAAAAANISVIRELEGKEIDMGKNSKKNNSRIFSTFVKNISWQIKDALWTPSTVNRHTEKAHTIKLLKTNDKGKILRTEKNIAEQPKDLLITSHQKWWKPENNGMRSLSC